MKLEAFDAIVAGKRIRCFMRDSRLIRRKKVILECGTPVNPCDWQYHGPMDIDEKASHITEAIVRNVRAIGIAVTEMPDTPTHFHVFDVRLDECDVRVYSEDPTLKAFRERLKQLRLGIDGDNWCSDEPTLVGEVDIKSKADAMRMGVDHDALVSQRYWATAIRALPTKEVLERKLLRKLREKSKDWGVIVTDVNISRIEVKQPNASTPNPSSIAAFSRDNAPPPVHGINDSGKFDTLRRRYQALTSMKDHQKRGYHLEQVLNEMFELEGFSPRGSFRIVGEQIDGSFLWNGRVHLLEAKWMQQPAAALQLGAFSFKLEGKSADTRGVFVSVGGFSLDGLAALRKKGNLKFICIDGAHLALALRASGNLKAILGQAWRHADETGESHMDASTMQF